jgi:hypothetical protein
MSKGIGKHLHSKLGAALVLAALATGITASAPAEAQSKSHNSQDPIVGTWLVTVAAEDGSPSFTVFETYSASGAVTAIDNQAPSSLETTSVGTWRKVGPRKYYETQWQMLYNPDGSFFGTWIGEIEDDLDASGTKMPSGPFTYTIVDAYGNVIDSGSGQSTAIKMPAPRGPQH